MLLWWAVLMESCLGPVCGQVDSEVVQANCSAVEDAWLGGGGSAQPPFQTSTLQGSRDGAPGAVGSIEPLG